MMVVRNTQARCDNCPYWFQLKPPDGYVGPSKGECRSGLPIPMLMPMPVDPKQRLLNPNAPQMQMMRVEWKLYVSDGDWVCGRHPFFLMPVPEAPSTDTEH